MHEKTLTKKNENSRTISQRNNTAKQLNKGKETNSCGSCGVCNRLRNPRISAETASLALFQAKGLGKESCAVSFMQSNYGNRFTASVLSPTVQKKTILRHSELVSESQGLNPTIQKKCSCGGSCERCKGEEEAERISMSIMKMESPALSHQPSAISYKPSANSSEQNLISEIMSNKGSGQRLDDNTRSFMEKKLGYDFSPVRLHTDSYAARKSNELNAEAFTIGRDVFFNAGRHIPTSTEGKRLLAHELTHVVQQSHQPRLQRLVRTSLVTCPAGQNPYSADRRASTLLDNAMTRIDTAVAERPVDPAHADVVAVGDAMHRAFRLNPANNDNWILAAPHFGLPLIRRRIEIAKGYIDSVVFTVRCIAAAAADVIPGCAAGTCNPGTEAFSCHANRSAIDLCPPFWALGLNQRGRTWAHEVLHIDFGFIDDWGQPDRANAHCYAQFVALLNGFNSPAGFRCH